MVGRARFQSLSTANGIYQWINLSEENFSSLGQNWYELKKSKFPLFTTEHLCRTEIFWASVSNLLQVVIIALFYAFIFHYWTIIKLSFIDFKTDCTKRSRLWVKEGGKTKLMKHCGKKEIPDYISRGGRVSVGIDFGPGAQALISYQAVKPRKF